LHDALTSRDPRVKYFAIISLLRRGQEPPRSVINTVAASAEMRNFLFEGLTSLKRADLFPQEFATQQSFAESDMVQWLTYPTELGRTPHEIELMESFENEGGTERYYLFRFRTHKPHWAADDGWRAGLSGPFDIAAMPTTSAGGGTFSMFTKWDELTPRAHFDAISGLVTKHWKQRAAELESRDER
jgi:hypothetical protein